MIQHVETPVVGREGVLDQAWRVLSAAHGVQLEGLPGIGKTAVWRALVARAREAGWLVLACAPTENEATLTFAALADVLEPLAEHATGLPEPQRVAADVVLLSAAPGQPVDERAVGAATRSLLAAAIGDERPVLLAIDDAPWLDGPSERALRYALRRLTRRPAVLVSCRTESAEPPEVPLGLEATAPVTRIALSPLGVGALHHIVYARLGRTLSRPLLGRIVRDAGGNPLMAIELARAVLRLPRPPRADEDLPVAASMQTLLAATMHELPARTRKAIRLAALLSAPTLTDLNAAGVDAVDLDPAEQAGLLTTDLRGVHFAHPVYASAVRTAIPAGERLALHRSLAEATADPDERARQLARCTTAPDAAVAAELAAAAARQRTRGAPLAAGELYDRAAQLTTSADAAERGRWLLEAVRCRFDSGDYASATAAAEAATVHLTGDLLAEAQLLRATVAWAADDLGAALAAGEQALAAARPGTPLQGRIHAHVSMFQDGPALARRHAEAAIELLDGSADDRPLLAGALLNLFFHEVRAGLTARTGLLDRALELEGGTPTWLAGTVPAIWWKATDDHERARRRLHEMLEHATANGDEPWQHELLTHLGEAELMAGRFAAAAERIAGARVLGQQLGTELVGETWLGGTLDAYQGRLAEADAVAQAGLRRAYAVDDSWSRRIHLQLAGFVALCDGRPGASARAYQELSVVLDESGVVEPIALRFEPDWIEACIGAGEIQTAQAVVDRLAERHQRLVRPWTTLGLARSRALVAAAQGADPEDLLDELAGARNAVPADVLPLDRARCLLVAGVMHRRARRKREAAQALSAAADEFTALGAAAFARRAHAELARTGSRSAPATELTPTEKRVARLAGHGRTNREIADALFISPKTVEANLARVYRKLGIARRAELGAAIASWPPEPNYFDLKN